jgi:excinuclease ABC subunit C
LQYQIRRCSAPCTQQISKQAYQQQVQYSTAFLEGKSQFVIDQLVQQMDKAAQAYAFEQAAIYRDQIESLRRISQQQYIQSGHINSDIIALSYQQGIACIHLLSMRHGQNRGSKNFFPKLPQLELDESEILSAFISQYYLNHQPPKEILIQISIINPSVLEALLSQLAGYKVGLKDKLRGNRLQWLIMAKKNAVYALEVKLNAKAHNQARIDALKEALDLSYLPKRLECFDISHMMGEATVASCVVFTREGAVKQEYRRFNIHNITAGDDYAAMRQVLQRRFKGIADNNAVAMSKQPDLVFIDGGKGQVQQALDVMDELNITDIDIIGVAKGEGRKAGLETLIINRGKNRKNLDEHSAALHLIQAIRDESHRFAINAHRQKRHKARLSSPLQQIKGLGVKRRQCLLKQFGGIQALSRASIEEITKIKGISLGLAEKVYQALQHLGKA